MDVRLPNGTVVKNVPDGMSKADLTAKLKANGMSFDEPTPVAEPSFLDSVKQGAGNLVAGAVRGAGSIGATLLTPYDLAVGNTSSIGNPERRQAMDDALQTMGAQPDSLLYKGGKLGGEIAGTAGAGSVLANALGRAAPVAVANSPRLAQLAEALKTGGFSLGTPAATTLAGKAADLGIRSAGGAGASAAMAGMVNPEDMGTGAVIGGVLPGAAQVAGKIGNAISAPLQNAAQSLMQSALKPTIAQLRTGDAQRAVDTLLQYGINPTKGGVAKLNEMVGGLNDQIAEKIADSGATISKQKVIDALNDVRSQFGKQVSPTSDLNAIQGVADDFAFHPQLIGDEIPVQAAQDMKQGTYRVLAKKYGQIGSAETEAQKGLARGLKDQIANAVPDVGALNAQESELINALKVSERRALMDLNKNPMGLAALTTNPASWAMFMADKSALFKSLAARLVNKTSSLSEQSGNLLGNSMTNPVIRNAGLLTLGNNQ